MNASLLYSIIGAAWIGVISSISSISLISSIVSTANAASNAATLYHQSFDRLPKLMEEEERLMMKVFRERRVETAERVAVGKVLRKLEPSLRTSSQAVQMGLCDWGLDYTKGMALTVPHLAQGLKVVRYLMVQAIYHWEGGAMDAGVQSWCVAVEMGRHLGCDPVVISRLMGITAQRIAIRTIAPFLFALDEALLRRAESRLRPFDKDVLEVIRSDISFMAPSLRDLPNQAKKGEEKGMMPEVAQFVKDHPGITSPGQIVAFERDLEEFQSYLSLPKQEAIIRLNAFHESVAAPARGRVSRSILSQFAFSAFNAIPEKDLQADVEIAMFRAAVAIRLGGEAALATVRDPSDRKPFRCSKWQGGFRLESKLEAQGEPVSLVFGKPQA